MIWLIAFGVGVVTGWIAGSQWQRVREAERREVEEYNLRMTTRADIMRRWQQ